MRDSGVLEAPTAAPGAHACWRFDDDASFHEAAVAFLGDGDARGERLLYVADAPEAELREHLAALGEIDRRLADGSLRLVPVRSVYEPGGVFDGEQQVETYRRLVREALADGFTGLRVAADATTMVATEASRRAFLRYEVLVDRLMATEPMSAMCAYDHRVLGDAVAALHAVHPLHHGAGAGAPGFCAFHDERTLRLVGEVDLDDREVFDAVVGAVAAIDADEVELDLSDVEFMDVHSLTELAQLAAQLEASGRSLRVGGAAPVVRRCCAVLGFDALRFEPAPQAAS